MRECRKKQCSLSYAAPALPLQTQTLVGQHVVYHVRVQAQMKAQERADRMADALRRKNKHLFRLPLRTTELPANTPGIAAPVPGHAHLVRCSGGLLIEVLMGWCCACTHLALPRLRLLSVVTVMRCGHLMQAEIFGER